VASGLRTGQSHSLEIEVLSKQAPLRVVLVYTDFPGPALMNNLNLIATSPTRCRYLGNASAGNTLLLDTRNNMECLHIKRPALGKWKIAVVDSNIPLGPQDFALV
jgi:serine protease AprX